MLLAAKASEFCSEAGGAGPRPHWSAPMWGYHRLVSEPIADETLRFVVGGGARSGEGLTASLSFVCPRRRFFSAAEECCGPSGAVLRQHVLWQILRDAKSVAGARSRPQWTVLTIKARYKRFTGCYLRFEILVIYPMMPLMHQCFPVVSCCFLYFRVLIPLQILIQSASLVGVLKCKLPLDYKSLIFLSFFTFHFQAS